MFVTYDVDNYVELLLCLVVDWLVDWLVFGFSELGLVLFGLVGDLGVGDFEKRRGEREEC